MKEKTTTLCVKPHKICHARRKGVIAQRAPATVAAKEKGVPWESKLASVSKTAKWKQKCQQKYLRRPNNNREAVVDGGFLVGGQRQVRHGAEFQQVWYLELQEEKQKGQKELEKDFSRRMRGTQKEEDFEKKKGFGEGKLEETEKT